MSTVKHQLTQYRFWTHTALVFAFVQFWLVVFPPSNTHRLQWLCSAFITVGAAAVLSNAADSQEAAQRGDKGGK